MYSKIAICLSILAICLSILAFIRPSINGEALGGSFMFDRKGEFIFDIGDRNIEDLELELIDHGADEIDESEGKVYVYTAYEDFGTMQTALEEMGIEVEEASLQRFPQVTKEVTDEEREDLERLIERFEDDEDVQKVFHGMA